MEVVFNDYSVDAQFSSVEEFVDTLVDKTIPILQTLSGRGDLLLKAYNSYSRVITDQVTLYDFLISSKFRGFPEAQKLKSLLSNLISDPFWESDSKTEVDAKYCCEFTGSFDGTCPNCFSEALERDRLLLSAEHTNFKTDEIEIQKNAELRKIYNFFNKKNAFKILFLNNCITFIEFLSGVVGDRNVIFYSNGSSYYADELWDAGDLTLEDAVQIEEDFKLLIDSKKTGTVLPRLTDSITYKDTTYMEFRTTLKGSREFRMFYYIDGSKWIFFDTLIKKTGETPLPAKRRTRGLISKYKKGN